MTVLSCKGKINNEIYLLDTIKSYYIKTILNTRIKYGFPYSTQQSEVFLDTTLLFIAQHYKECP